VTVTSLSELVAVRAEERGDHAAFRFIDSGTEWSYGELAERSGRVGGFLAARGLVPASHVGILTDDRATFCEAFFGAHAAGVVPVPLGIAGRVGSISWRAVLRDRVARFGLGAILTDPARVTELASALAPTPVFGIDGGVGSPAEFGDPAPHAFIQPSSGTTGDPKGVVVSHRAVLANLAAIGQHWELGPDDIGLSWLPLFHDMGLIGTMINAIFQGATLYHWPTASFLRSPGRWLQLVAELGVTIPIAPPFALQLVTRRQQRRPSVVDLGCVRHLLVGAEQIRPEVLDDFSAAFAPMGLGPGVISPTYGLAEATLAVSANPAGAPYRVVEVGRHRLVSCGRPLPGISVSLTGDQELVVRTPALMDGYLDDPVATAAAIGSGELRTGDTAAILDGDVVILGRQKEMINRGGVRLPASDFELALAGVDGVLPDRIVAFADVDETGERVVVLAESRWTTRAGEAILASRARLADAGLPVDVVELVPPGFIPRTTSGKLRRAEARERWRNAAMERSTPVVS
jgi:Acyl-CoA synthetases (AMP-forming)/AMP-acid ligases II